MTAAAGGSVLAPWARSKKKPAEPGGLNPISRGRNGGDKSKYKPYKPGHAATRCLGMDDMTEADWAARPNPVYPNV